MENAQEILVVFLSVALGLFLVLSIIFLILLIKIAGHINRISEKAEQLTDKAENIADFFTKASTPLAIGRVISMIADIFTKRSNKKRSRSDE